MRKHTLTPKINVHLNQINANLNQIDKKIGLIVAGICLNSFKVMYLKEVPDNIKKNLDYKNKFSSVAPLKTFLPGIQCNEFKGKFFHAIFFVLRRILIANISV